MLRKWRFLLSGLLLLTILSGRAEEMPDSVGAPAGSAPRRSSTEWIRQLCRNGFHLNDPAVDYPRFPRFVVKVYNWGDRTFNSYDTTYVQGLGTNWKLFGKGYGWTDVQTFSFPKSSRISMYSKFFADAGGYISFMAVSVGYMWNVNNLWDAHGTKRHTFNLDFTCSRFSINYNHTTATGGMIINRFGDFNNGHHIHVPFDGADLKMNNFDAIYIFNHRKYSHAAAYSYSKYQLKGAGTAIVGFNYNNHDLSIDFGRLPAAMLEHLPLENPNVHLHYRDLAVLGGYAHNWALKPRRWLVNLTVLGAIGYKHTYEDATDGERHMVANNYRLSSAVVYHHRALFAALSLRLNGSLYYNSNFIHFSSLTAGTLLVGVRF